VNPEALEQALQQPYQPPEPAPSPVQPIGAGITEAVEDCARSLAQKHRLIDDTGQLHCWHCGGPCAWHVSLQCVLCRKDSPRRKREQDERERAEKRAQQQREQEQSRPVQRVANRRYGDDY
jgi:hypothetical protein